MSKLGDYLKEKRTAAGKTQWDVARALGYKTNQFISNFERGVSIPPTNTVDTLATLYKVDASEILTLLTESAVTKAKAKVATQYEVGA